MTDIRGAYQRLSDDPGLVQMLIDSDRARVERGKALARRVRELETENMNYSISKSTHREVNQLIDITKFPGERKESREEMRAKMKAILADIAPPAEINVEAEIQKLVSAVTRLTRVFDGRAAQQMERLNGGSS